MSNWNVYDRFRRNQHQSGGVDLEDDATFTLRIAIVASGYTPDQNTHEFFSSITNEVSGDGYTAGGNELENPTVTMDGAGLVTYDADDPAPWAQDSGGFTNGRRFILYLDAGTPETSPLIAYSDAESVDFGNVDGPVTVEIDEAGLFTIPR